MIISPIVVAHVSVNVHVFRFSTHFSLPYSVSVQRQPKSTSVCMRQYGYYIFHYILILMTYLFASIGLFIYVRVYEYGCICIMAFTWCVQDVCIPFGHHHIHRFEYEIYVFMTRLKSTCARYPNEHHPFTFLFMHGLTMNSYGNITE